MTGNTTSKKLKDSTHPQTSLIKPKSHTKFVTYRGFFRVQMGGKTLKSSAQGQKTISSKTIFLNPFFVNSIHICVYSLFYPPHSL